MILVAIAASQGVFGLEFDIVQASASDASAIESLANVVYPTTSGWPALKLKSHVKLFPDGQILAVAGSGQIVGASLNLILDWAQHPIGSKYRQLIADGWFTSHSPGRGKFLYGADLMVHPNFRRMGIGSGLVNTKISLAKKLGLSGLRSSVRLGGNDLESGQSLDDYATAVLDKRIHDSVLNFHRHCGMQFISILYNHFESRDDACPHALLAELPIGQPLISSKIVAQEK